MSAVDESSQNTDETEPRQPGKLNIAELEMMTLDELRDMASRSRISYFGS
jgi:hypothetical protein